MENLNIGRSGIEVPFLGMGTWAIGGGSWWGDNDDALSVKAIQTAVEQGIRWIDTAPIYGLYHSETVVGEALKHIDRDKVVLSTKCGLEWRHETPVLHKVVDGTAVYRDLSAQSIIEDVEDSLRRLGTDHLDVLYTHWQSPDLGLYPLEETVEAMMKLKEQGKIRAIGASNVTADLIRGYCRYGQLVYGDNVFEKDGIRRDRTGDGEKTRCLCGKQGIFNRDGPAMGPQIIRQLERRASRRSASFFHALASPGRPRNGGGASGAYQPAEGRKALIQGRFRAQEGPLGPSRKSQQQTKRTGFAALEDSIADEAPEGKRAKRANRALNRAGINSRGQKQGFGGADRRAGRVTSR